MSTGVGPMLRPKTQRRRPGGMTPSSASANVGSHGGVARHGHLAPGREDAHPDVGVRPFRRQDEGGFREVHLLRHGLHRLGREAARVEEDGQLVAAELLPREDVEVQVAVSAAHDASPPGAAPPHAIRLPWSARLARGPGLRRVWRRSAIR